MEIDKGQKLRKQRKETSLVRIFRGLSREYGNWVEVSGRLLDYLPLALARNSIRTAGTCYIEGKSF